MRCLLARLLERAAVLEVGRDPRAAEGVVADLGCDAGRLGATAHHSPSIVSVEPPTIELRLPTTIRAIFDGLEEGNPTGLGQAGALNVLGEVALQRMMAGHFVELAALLVEPHPEPPLLVEDVAHVQAAETRAKVNTMTPIRARSRSPTTVSVSIERNSSPAASAVSLGVLPLAELLARCLHGQRRVVLEHTAGDQAIEQHADSGHVLLEGGGREAVGLCCFQVVAHIEGTDVLYA